MKGFKGIYLTFLITYWRCFQVLSKQASNIFVQIISYALQNNNTVKTLKPILLLHVLLIRNVIHL